MSYEITFMLSNAEEFSFGGSLPQSKLINQMRELEMVQMPKNRLAVVLKMGKVWQIDCQQSTQGGGYGARERHKKSNCDDNMMMIVIFLNVIFIKKKNQTCFLVCERLRAVII